MICNVIHLQVAKGHEYGPLGELVQLLRRPALALEHAEQLAELGYVESVVPVSEMLVRRRVGKRGKNDALCYVPPATVSLGGTRSRCRCPGRLWRSRRTTSLHDNHNS